MSSAIFTANAQCIDRELKWFNDVLESRIKLHFDGIEATSDLLASLPPPEIPNTDVPYSNIVRQFKLNSAERLILILSFIPHIKPHLLDPLFIRNQSLDRGYTEFGGTIGSAHGGFLPSCETAMFLLAGDNLHTRLQYDRIFNPRHIFFSQGILLLEHQSGSDPPLSAPLHLSPEFRERLTTGSSYIPPFSSEFPAQKMTSTLDWSDLVLEPSTQQDIDDILVWLNNKELLMDRWRLHQRIGPGYRSLFYGPPGTGKSMTACLLGQKSGLPVFRIDLSKTLSKYIGETEKNLAQLFDRAQHRNWILFFDEAESLFGKRVESRNSNDRAANQQVSYLLQRLETYSGLAILATNLRADLDEAFTRRFQSIIRFPIPNAERRLQLWQGCFIDKPFDLAEDIDFATLARDYELTGGDIVNILRFACLKAVARNPATIYAADLLKGIDRELQKQGRLGHQPPSHQANGGFLGSWSSSTASNRTR